MKARCTVALTSKEKQEIHEAGQKWAKEESKMSYGERLTHLRSGSWEFLSSNNEERRDVFQKGVDNFNETAERNEPRWYETPKQTTTQNASSLENDSPGDTTDDDYSPSYDDSPTSYTSSPNVSVKDDSPTSYTTGSSSVSAKKEVKSGESSTGMPPIIKFLLFVAVIFAEYNLFIKDAIFPAVSKNKPMVEAQASIPSAPVAEAPIPEVATIPAPVETPRTVEEPEVTSPPSEPAAPLLDGVDDDFYDKAVFPKSYQSEPSAPRSINPFSREGADGIIDRVVSIRILETTGQRLPGTQVVIRFNDGSKIKMYLSQDATIEDGDRVHVWLFGGNRGTLVQVRKE